jgi:hypothetical protein
MPMTVNGTAEERARIERWLQQICWRIRVDANTGAVSEVQGPPAPGAHQTGCACLSGMIAGRRTVTIQPLNGPATVIPGTGGVRVRDGGGGVTTRPPGAQVQPNGQPGTGADGNPGSDCTTYVDITNNQGGGYGHGYPMWFVLAHELTTGHASHNVAGTAATTSAGRERQAISSEHAHAEAHGLPLRPLPQ